MNNMGHHCLLNVYGCNFELLNNEEFLIRVLKKAAKECGATVLNMMSHKFEPQGVTAILLLSESHISVHTFPEYGKAAFDIFTCGRADSKLGVQWILQQMNAEYHTLIDIGR
jgi:S-adenosylmethionine decarboxylase